MTVRAGSGRFAEYTTAELVGQLRMEARDKLSPDMTEFLTACADRLDALAGSGAGDGALREALEDKGRSATEFIQAFLSDQVNGGFRQGWTDALENAMVAGVSLERRRLKAALASHPSATGATSDIRAKWARDLNDSELVAEYVRTSKLFDGRGEHGGSPGEAALERCDECFAEMQKRGLPDPLATSDKGGVE